MRKLLDKQPFLLYNIGTKTKGRALRVWWLKMKINVAKKVLRISAFNGEGENVKCVKVSDVSNQNFENAIKTFLATIDCEGLEILGGIVDLQFNFRLE